MNEQKRQRLGMYLNVINQSKAKLDYQDCFMLGIAFSNFTKNGEDLEDVVTSIQENKKSLRGVALNDNQKLDNRIKFLEDIQDGIPAQLLNQQKPKPHNGNAQTLNSNLKKRSYEETGLKKSEDEIKILAENDFHSQNGKRKVIQISEIEFQSDEEEGRSVPIQRKLDNIPSFTDDSLSNSVFKKNSFDKKSSANSASVSGNGLGFINNEKISDLNQAIDSLDNTQFRGSIKAGSKSAGSHNDLSQELPLNTNLQDNSQKVYSSMSQNVDVQMLQEKEQGFDISPNDQNGGQIHKEFSFNHLRGSSTGIAFAESIEMIDTSTNRNKNQYYNQLDNKNKQANQFVVDDDDLLELLEEEKGLNFGIQNNFEIQGSIDPLTKDLILKLQEEEEQERNNLLKQKDEHIDENFKCPVCFDGYDEENILPLTSCDHVFHRECLQIYLNGEIQESKFPLKCPENACQKELLIEDLNDILSEEQRQKHLEFTFNQAIAQQQDMMWCPTADCKNVLVIEEGVNELHCDQCNKDYCGQCKVEYHKERTCAQFQAENQNDKEFLEFVKGKQFKQCPFCQFWVEKSEGCDHMTCKCKKEFCYKCGGVYRACECTKENQRQEALRRQRFQEARRIARIKRAEQLKRELEKEKQSRQIIQIFSNNQTLSIQINIAQRKRKGEARTLSQIAQNWGNSFGDTHQEQYKESARIYRERKDVPIKRNNRQ
eukprot:403371984